MKILVADDEQDICQAIGDIVTQHGYSCCFANDGTTAVDVFRTELPDLVLLDVMMPGKNGFDVCSEIRAQNTDVPIILVSAKSDIVDKSVGFAMGADDYVSKPFNPEELMMRIEAGLRRVRASAEKEGGGQTVRHDGSHAVVTLGDLEILLKRAEVLKNGRPVNLTPKEFQIIAYLANHLGEVRTNKEIIDYVW